MADAAPVVVAPVEAPSAAGEVDTVDSRAEVLKMELRAEKNKPQPAADSDEGPGDDDGEPVEAPAPADEGDEEEAEPIAAAPVVDPAVEERKIRLQRAKDLEKRAHVTNERMIAREQRATERERAAETRVAEAEKRYAEAEKILAWQESVKNDPSVALQFVGDHIPADKLGDWMVKSQDPATRAEWATKRALEEAQKEASKPNAEIAAMRAEMDALKQERAQLQHAEKQRSELRAVADMATANEEHVPYAARLASRQPQKFAALVNASALQLRRAGEPLSYEAILQHAEAELSSYADVYAPKTAAGDAAPSATSLPAPASKARTLTSRTTAGRSTLASQDDRLAPLDERADELKLRIARGDSF